MGAMPRINNSQGERARRSAQVTDDHGFNVDTFSKGYVPMVCPFWKRGGCRLPADKCSYEHRDCDDNGRPFRLADMPRTDPATGRTVAGHNVAIAHQRNVRAAAKEAQGARQKRSDKLDRIQTQNWRDLMPVPHNDTPGTVDPQLKKSTSQDTLLSSTRCTVDRTTDQTSPISIQDVGPILAASHPGVQNAERLLSGESDSILGLRVPHIRSPPKCQSPKRSRYILLDRWNNDLRYPVDLSDMAVAPIGFGRPSQIVQLVKESSRVLATVGIRRRILRPADM